MTCLCCGKPGERAAWSDSCPNTYVCVDCKSLPARFEKLQRDANESNRILGDQCERAEAEVARLTAVVRAADAMRPLILYPGQATMAYDAARRGT